MLIVVKKTKKKKTARKTDNNNGSSKKTALKTDSNNGSSRKTKAKTTEEHIKSLIEKGEKKGFLTYDEMNQALPEEAVSPTRLDHLLATLDEMGVDLLDEAHVQKQPEEEGWSLPSTSRKRHWNVLGRMLIKWEWRSKMSNSYTQICSRMSRERSM